MAKKKNKKNKKPVQPQRPAQKTEVKDNVSVQRQASEGKYVARRKRDIEKEKKLNQNKAQTDTSYDADIFSEKDDTQDKGAHPGGVLYISTDGDNTAFFVASDEKPKKKNKREEKRLAREEKKRAEEEKKRALAEKKNNQRKQKKQAKLDKKRAAEDAKAAEKEKKQLAKEAKKAEKTTIAVIGENEDPEAMAEYMQKVSDIEAWNAKFSKIMLRAGVGLLAFILVMTVLWNVEVARVSIEGKETYEISINAFGMVSNVYDIDTAAILKEEKVRTGSTGVVVFRLIHDMYNNPSDGVAYADGEPILIGIYGPSYCTSVLETGDFSLGKANIQVRRAKKQDKINSENFDINLGRSVLIREYTENYGGDHTSNVNSLRSATIMEIIDRESVTDEATKVVADIFSAYTVGEDVPMIITDGSTPAPITPTPAPAAPVQPRRTTTTRRTTSSSSSNRATSSSSTSSSGSTANEAENTTAPSAAPITTTEPSATVRPVDPIREATRPTANPTVED